MTWHFPNFIIAYIISAFFTGLFGIFAWRHRPTPGAASFAFMMLAIVYWTLMGIPEASVVETWAKIFWTKLEYPGIASAGLLWLIFSARFSRYDAWLTKKTIALLWVIPFITVLMVCTNEWHHLQYTGFTPTKVDDAYVLIYHRGPWFWVHITYNYLMLLAGSSLLIKAVINYPKLYRRQALPILVSIIIPWGANILYVLRVGPFSGMDLTPISFAMSGLVFYWSLFHSRVFKIVPMARDLLVEKMHEGIIVLDNKHKVIDVNPAALQFFRDITPLVGKDAQEVCTLWPLLSPHMMGKSVEHGEVIVKGDPLRTFMFTISPLNDLYGNISGHLIVLRDITDRKQAEEALRDSEEKFRNIFESSPDPSYITALDGRIIEFNNALMTVSGYSSEDINGMNIIDFYAYPEERKIFIERILREGCVENCEMKAKKKDGTLIEALATVVPRKDRDGNVIGFQGITKDMTEKKRMEIQLLQSEKLSALGTMISGVAHELNNPLTSIIGNAQLLEKKDVPDDIKKRLAVIIKESLRSAKIISGLLAFAREHKPKQGMVNINTIVVESMKLKEYDLRVNNIDVKASLSEDLPETYADPFHLEQVFINIINNARDALSDLDGSALVVRTYEKDDTILIEFEDNGPGIPDEFIKKIFDPFFTTKEVGKGTGLGLSIAYGIIKEHKGAITVESKPGKGAKFVVAIPIRKGMEPREREVITHIQSPGDKKTILVVDDETSLRNLLFETLTEGGFLVEVASTGEQAIEIIETRKFDAVISDIKMPGIDGKQLYQYIQKHHPEITEKIIFITGDILNKETQLFIHAANNKFIEKPFDIDVLLSMLNDVLSG
jgi:PAS domain S-box-containing protein